jgi:hypothetical protein
MKNKMIKLAVVAAASVALAQTVQAGLINGSVTFAGGVTLDTTSAGTATEVVSWTGPQGSGLLTPVVESSSGDLAAVFSAPVTFTPNWVFGTGINPLWSYVGLDGDTFTFNLLSSSIFSQGGSPASVTVDGTGTITATGPVTFGATTGTWSFSTQDPSAGTPATFSFSAAVGSVPDGGTTAMLLGAGLSGLALLKRKLVA